MSSSFLKNHYNHILMYDLITKFHLKNIFQIPKIQKIILNIGCKEANIEKKKMIAIFLFLKIITNQEIFGAKSKKNNILLKIKKGTLVGCKVTLHRKFIYFFLEKIILFIIPNIKEFKGFLPNSHLNFYNFKIKNFLNFFEMEQEFIRFQNLSKIDVNIQFKNSKKQKYNINMLNHMQIPFQKMKM